MTNFLLTSENTHEEVKKEVLREASRQVREQIKKEKDSIHIIIETTKAEVLGLKGEGTE